MFPQESKPFQHHQGQPVSRPGMPSLSWNSRELTNPPQLVRDAAFPRGSSWKTPSWGAAEMNVQALAVHDFHGTRQVMEPVAETFACEELQLDSGAKVLPWLAADVVANRRVAMGLSEAGVQEFVNACEFVSLGCFCGVTRALQCLDLKQRSYPFDWVRSDVAGVIRCLQSDFKNFASSSFKEQHPAAKNGAFHGGATWGGSFWHHNPKDPATAIMFERRIERLMSRNREIAADQSRVFLIACNSSADVLLVPELQVALQNMLPEAVIYLLVFIDNQRVQGPLRLAGRRNVIFYLTSEELFANMGRLADGTQVWSEQKHAELYAEGLAAAIRAWADTRAGGRDLAEVPNLAVLHRQTDPFNGGDCSKELYWPLRASCHPRVDEQRMEKAKREQRDGHGKEVGVCGLLPWPLDQLFSFA